MLELFIIVLIGCLIWIWEIREEEELSPFDELKIYKESELDQVIDEFFKKKRRGD